MQRTVCISVSGKVQGVFFRQSTKEMANALNLTGEVRNTDDGKVEIFASGEQNEIDHLIRWCRMGPPKAKVEDISVKDVENRSFEKFSIKR